MLILKEGLTDQSLGVREACTLFLKPLLINENGLIEDLSLLFKMIDCKQIFIKEYYIQLPFIIMRLIFHLAEEDETKVAKYLEL